MEDDSHVRLDGDASVVAVGQGVTQDKVYAYMWWNAAASSGHKDAIYNRDTVKKQMTSADISAAKKLARECVRKKYKGC